MSATLTFDYDSPLGTGGRSLALAPAGPKGDTGPAGPAPSGTGLVQVISGTASTLTHPDPSPAGSYTLASVTVDSTGRVTAASSGAAGGIAIGDTVTNGTAGRVLYVGAGGLLAETEAIRVHVASGFLIIPAIYDGFASRNIYLTGDYVVTERAVRVEGWVAHPEFPVLEARSAGGQTGPLLRLSDSGGTTLSAILAGGGWQPASMTDAAAPNNTVYYSTTASKLVYKDGGGVVNTLY